jgi:hypothetical protein
MGFGEAESLRGDARWHGVCLALAELARRGLVKEEVLGETVTWVLKVSRSAKQALTTGPLVRSAKSISLGRSQRTRCRCLPAVVTITSLLAIFLRALRGRYRYRSDTCSMLRQGSRSPQGRQCSIPRRSRQTSESESNHERKPSTDRQGLYPEGIDVLGKTDFFSVSVRRVAFTTAAPAVAV